MFQSFVQQMYKKERLEQTFITVKTIENLISFVYYFLRIQHIKKVITYVSVAWGNKCQYAKQVTAKQ